MNMQNVNKKGRKTENCENFDYVSRNFKILDTLISLVFIIIYKYTGQLQFY